ncbi:hypothetical protein [Saccharospirillum impatiens]|uniref:hypothetical protein n=1 Tax=Saccharospirillum impatiens TaxID=169438 RepID=UPI0003F9F6C0|nr:hypothetical protein [Saccharospirillum impatiens]
MLVQKHTGKRIALWLLATALLAGCATTPNPTQSNDDNLLGQNVGMLYQQWGEPVYRSEAAGQAQQLHIWDRSGCMNNVTTRTDGTIIGFAVTGDCDY